jgi:hypothetical protein
MSPTSGVVLKETQSSSQELHMQLNVDCLKGRAPEPFEPLYMVGRWSLGGIAEAPT